MRSGAPYRQRAQRYALLLFRHTLMQIRETNRGEQSSSFRYEAGSTGQRNTFRELVGWGLI
jgi:hypothetical protein